MYERRFKHVPTIRAWRTLANNRQILGKRRWAKPFTTSADLYVTLSRGVKEAGYLRAPFVFRSVAWSDYIMSSVTTINQRKIYHTYNPIWFKRIDIRLLYIKQYLEDMV